MWLIGFKIKTAKKKKNQKTQNLKPKPYFSLFLKKVFAKENYLKLPIGF